ncbi:MAG: HAD family hydrolase [Bacteroidetes bacterium]|nr:HAD family hydrolase [Bacteroidota bacterium]
MLKHYTHVIWDWNGTLFNDVHVCLDIINNILEANSYNRLTFDRYREIFTFPVKEYYRAAGVDFGKHPFEIIGKEWADTYEVRRHEMDLFEQVETVLSKVAGHGIKQYILSAYVKKELLDVVEKHGLTGYFEEIHGLGDVYAHSKLELGLDLINRLGDAKKSAVLVGDTLHDYEVAKEMGIDCILTASGHQTKERLLAAGVPVFDSINDFVEELK